MIGGLTSSALFRRAMMISPSRNSGALLLHDLGDHGEGTTRLARLHEVLEWTRLHAASTSTGWELVFRRILILPGGGPLGTYRSRLRGCTLSDDLVLNGSRALIAMVIEHEACHARIASGRMPDIQGDEDLAEQRCVEAEIALGLVLPDAEQEVELARDHLTRRGWRASGARTRLDHAMRVLKGAGQD